MSGVSDKARFYLEQSVPQLQEFEQKKIFSKDEIKTLVKKRSDFEHKILARGTKPVDFVRYAAWEISLEKLRQKRCKRLQIKGSSAHAGQARIFLIFDRAIRKHPGDVGLWMSYLQYARDVKASKKFKKVLTAALRMHPTKVELWLYAANSTLEIDSDMNGARGYMQRGTRFCTRSKEMWIEYAKLEMIYLAKISVRRSILGIGSKKTIQALPEVGKSEEQPAFSPSEDIVHLPDVTMDLFEASTTEETSAEPVEGNDPMATPALNGAIPLAIFDNSRKQPFYTPAVAEEFFDMFATFVGLPCLSRVLQHVLDRMMETHPTDPSTSTCFIRQVVIGIEPMTAEFPMALAAALERLKGMKERTADRVGLATKTRAWMEPLLAVEGLDEGIRRVLTYTLRTFE